MPFLWAPEGKANHRISYLIKLTFLKWKRHFLTSWLHCIFSLTSPPTHTHTFVSCKALLCFDLVGQMKLTPFWLFSRWKQGDLLSSQPLEKMCYLQYQKYQTARSFCLVALLGCDEGFSFITGRKVEWSGIVISPLFMEARLSPGCSAAVFPNHSFNLATIILQSALTSIKSTRTFWTDRIMCLGCFSS